MGLDSIISRLQSATPFTLGGIDGAGSVTPGRVVDLPAIIAELLLDADVTDLAQIIPAQIVNWGRLAAQAKRVWEIRERNYRIWRDTLYLQYATPEEGQKKPTESFIQANIRKHPKYAQWYAIVEEAEESYNACLAILDGWRAKKDMFKTGLIRQLENTAS